MSISLLQTSHTTVPLLLLQVTTIYFSQMFKLTARSCSHSRPNLLATQKRFASLISSPNDPKLVNLLSRLEKFDKESGIFGQLDDLYLLTQRKGFFNINSNNLEFLSNSHKITNNYTNLYNFNDLNQLVANQYSNMLLLPPTPQQQISSITSSPSSLNDPLANIPGLTVFNSNGYSNSIAFGRNSPVDKYLKLLNNLAKNDVELKSRIENVLRSFDKEDDFFFNYVLQFWINGKNFNKSKLKKHNDAGNRDGINHSNLGL